MNNLEELRLTYPRVSDIISKQNAAEFKSIPIQTLANACIRGTKVHDYCTAWVKGLWVDGIEPEYQPYFDAFVHWYKTEVEDVIQMPTRLYDDEKRFTGEFDMIVKMKGKKGLALIDIKTSCNKSKTWPVQLAAYAHLCDVNEIAFDYIVNVHLKKTQSATCDYIEGEKVEISPLLVKPMTIEYGDIIPYWQIFHSALQCYDYFERKEAK